MKSSDYRQLKVWQKAMELTVEICGSLWELETQIEICVRLNYIDSTMAANVYNLTTEVSKMLNSLSNSLETKN